MALPFVGNWTVEQTSTQGTGSITLGGSDLGFARFKDSIPVGQVWYAIQDGTSKEAGVGYFNGNDTLIRQTVTATLVGGVYNNINPTPINLTGNAVVGCTVNAQAYFDLDEKEDGLGNPPVDDYVLSSDTQGNRLWVPNNTGTLDHTQLNNRDVADQHPINAITGLLTALQNKENELGLPAANGYILSSDTLGNRTWIENTGAGGGTNDHNLLLNRDASDQHIIGAITGLQSALDAKEDFLGNPTVDGYVLSSLIDGTRSWVANAGGGGTDDHNLLINRSVADQHPIGAITGLQSALDNKSDITHLHTGVYEPANVNIQNHIADDTPDVSNPHNITKVTISLGNVDNTSDLDKPVSTAQQAEIDTKEDDLGDPLVDGYILSSTTLGVRSWIPKEQGVNDHSILINRDLADQHPISAITNLQTNLDSKLDHTNGTSTGQFETALVIPAVNIDVSAANIQSKDISGVNTTFTFSGWPAALTNASVTVKLTMLGTESLAFTGANFDDVPVPQAGLNVFVFESDDAGTTINGYIARDAS